jgi:hypothetical protein
VTAIVGVTSSLRMKSRTAPEHRIEQQSRLRSINVLHG